VPVGDGDGTDVGDIGLEVVLLKRRSSAWRLAWTGGCVLEA
jgi:hypothetical protein